MIDIPVLDNNILQKPKRRYNIFSDHRMLCVDVEKPVYLNRRLTLKYNQTHIK